MGAFLAALGAVLLFILRVIGILLLVVLILLVLLLLCPFCADVCWQNDTLTVKAGALGITFPVFQYPKPEPPAQPEEPKGFTGRLKAKFRAWRAERKRKKAKKKAAQPAKPKAEKPPRQKAKITLDVICTMLRGVGTLLRAVFGALRFTRISVCLGVRGDDPAAAARSYGKLQAWLYPVLGVLEGTFELAGESILSRYVSRDRVYSGCEVLTLQADGSYHNAGVSMKNGRRMSAWTAVLSEERGRT